MPNRRENVLRKADLVSVVSECAESLNAAGTFTFTGDNYRWFYICRRRA